MARFRIDKVQQMVEDDFCQGGPVSNRWHGISEDEVLDHLITPRSMRFVQLTQVGFVWLWAVFDEKPDSDRGLLIVFDPRKQRYGLASKPCGRRLGTFFGFGAYDICSEIRAM